MKWHKNTIKETPYQLQILIKKKFHLEDMARYSKYKEKIEDRIWERMGNSPGTYVPFWDKNYWAEDWKQSRGFRWNRPIITYPLYPYHSKLLY